MEKEAKEKANKQGIHDTHHIDGVINEMIKERKGVDQAVEIFNSIDADGNGSLDLEQFTEGEIGLLPCKKLLAGMNVYPKTSFMNLAQSLQKD